MELGHINYTIYIKVVYTMLSYRKNICHDGIKACMYKENLILWFIGARLLILY